MPEERFLFHPPEVRTTRTTRFTGILICASGWGMGNTCSPLLENVVLCTSRAIPTSDTRDHNTTAGVCMAGAMLLRQRNIHLSALHHIVGLVLFHGNISKQVILYKSQLIIMFSLYYHLLTAFRHMCAWTISNCNLVQGGRLSMWLRPQGTSVETGHGTLSCRYAVKQHFIVIFLWAQREGLTSCTCNDILIHCNCYQPTAILLVCRQTGQQFVISDCWRQCRPLSTGIAPIDGEGRRRATLVSPKCC